MDMRGVFLLVLCCLATTTAKTTIEAADEILFIRNGGSTPECSLSVNDRIPASASLYLRFNNVRLTEDADVTDLDFHIRAVDAGEFSSRSFYVNIVAEPDPASRSCSVLSSYSYADWDYRLGVDSLESASSFRDSNDWDIPNSLLENVVRQSSWKDLRSSVVVIVRPTLPDSVGSNAFWDVNTRPYLDIDWRESSSSGGGGVNIGAYIGPVIFVIIIVLIVVCSVCRRGARGCLWFASNSGSTTTKTVTTKTVVTPATTTTTTHVAPPQQPVAYGTPMPTGQPMPAGQPYAQPPQGYATPQPYGTQPGYAPQGQPYPPQGQPYPPQGQPYHTGPVVPPPQGADASPYAEDSPYQ